MDHGYHQVRSRLAEGVRSTPFCYLHFHHKPFAIMLEHARRKLDGRMDYYDPDALKKYKGDGDHLTKYFLMSKKKYEQDSDDLLNISVPDFVREAVALGIDRILFDRAVTYGHDTTEIRLPGRPEMPFRAGRYLDANPDVRVAGVDPLYHYLRHGWLEGRPLG